MAGEIRAITSQLRVGKVKVTYSTVKYKRILNLNFKEVTQKPIFSDGKLYLFVACFTTGQDFGIPW